MLDECEVHSYARISFRHNGQVPWEGVARCLNAYNAPSHHGHPSPDPCPHNASIRHGDNVSIGFPNNIYAIIQSKPFISWIALAMLVALSTYQQFWTFASMGGG